MTDIDESDEGVLRRFMQEFFPFDEFLEIGFFTSEMRNDYEAQAERVRTYFGFSTVFEYGSKSISAHISDGGKSEFITHFTSIYED